MGLIFTARKMKFESLILTNLEHYITWETDHKYNFVKKLSKSVKF